MRIIIACLVLTVAAQAQAAPGLGEQVYSATLEPDVTEVELRYGRLTGGRADGEDALVGEVAHTFGTKFYGAVLGEFGREADGSRRLGSIGVEGILPTGRIDALGIDTAAYVEYDIGRRDVPDHLETKLLLSRVRGGFDARANIIVEKNLTPRDAVNLGYAASADWAVIGEFRGGFAAFGELGGVDHFGGRNEHYIGPVVKTELEHLPGRGELQIEAGYLFSVGAVRDNTPGQVRLLLEYEFHF